MPGRSTIEHGPAVGREARIGTKFVPRVGFGDIDGRGRGDRARSLEFRPRRKDQVARFGTDDSGGADIGDRAGLVRHTRMPVEISVTRTSSLSNFGIQRPERLASR